MAFAVFLAVLFFAPLAFGSTEVWSAVTLELLVALTGLCCFLPFFRSKTVFYAVPGLVPLLLFIGWMCLQCIPLPMSLVRLLSPHTAAIYQPVLDFLPNDTWIPLTVSRQASLLECLRLSACALFYVLTVQLLNSSLRLTRTVTAVAVLAMLLAFASALQRAAAPETLFWFRELKGGHGSFGPWVYKNHYAGFMVMTCPLVLALFLLHRSAGWEGESLRDRFIALFSGPGASLHLMFGFGALVVLSSIFLSQSRGGILSITFTLLLCFLLLARSQGKIQSLTLLALTVLLIAIVSAAGWFSWEPVLERFSAALDAEHGRFQDARLWIWQDTVRLIADFPLTGAGFGSFADMFPSYKSFPGNLLYDHAHNDYLELLAEGGLIGSIFAIWFAASVLRAGLRQIFVRHDRAAVLLSVAAFSGIGGMLVFSSTDFNLHNGANTLYFFFLCGLLVSAGHVRQQYRQRPSLLAPAASPAKAKLAGFAAAAVLLLAVLRIQGGILMADEHYRRAHQVSAAMQRPAKKIVKMTALLEAAWRSNPFSGLYPYALANMKRYQKQDDQALALHTAAALLQPLEGAYLQSIGLLLEPAQARLLLERGCQVALQKDGPLRTWAAFELPRNRAEGLRILRTALAKDPALLKAIYPLLTQHSFTQEEIAAVLPETASAWLQHWNLARADGQEAEGRFFIEHALEHVDKEPQPQPQLFMQVYGYYCQQKGKEEQAVEVLREGIRCLPDYAPFHILLGEYYQGKDITYRALEEYGVALLIQPGNAALQERVRKLKLLQARP